ncbi:hypothetical protein [Streptomyces sp. NPDC101166]|uniref:hypothetical protein n=1 Tax=Streptomyces sp. NPDC101166 TaxID=3366120 RepID=UPI00381D22C5
MATWRDPAIGTLKLAGVTDIAAAVRSNARDATRPLVLLLGRARSQNGRHATTPKP